MSTALPTDVPTDQDPLQVHTEAAPLARPVPNLYELLPIPQIDLSPSEQEVVERYTLGRMLVGPAANAAMTCPPPPVLDPNVTIGPVTALQMMAKHVCCPYIRSCPLFKVNKAPHGEICPIEQTYVIERFVRWCREFGKEPNDINETERVNASELTWLDIQEHRDLSVLGEAEAARMADISVGEVANNGDPLAYEKVIHVNKQDLVQISNQRKQILKSFELTPEMKTKKSKGESAENGPDLATLQSIRADKFKKRHRLQ